ncbi:MAG: hypothetical protein Q4G69_02610 [Planctomycetia bacterium]|nr:hypothetical protein [Planctomycetia bacterium]
MLKRENTKIAVFNGRNRFFFRFCRDFLPIFFLFILLTGCGTTKWSDTGRTATEQLLISSAIEDVIDEFDFYPLAGRKVFIKKDGINCTDNQYLFTVLRQQLAANGVFIKDKEDEAEYILEIAPGAVGTNRYDLMYGISKTEVPSVLSGGTVSTIPEISLIKRTDQKAQVKLMMWAYNKKNGSIIWQSGTKSKTAFIRDRWFFGIGPISKSSFEPKIKVVGDNVEIPGEENFRKNYIAKDAKPSVKTEAVYREIDQESMDRLEAIREDGRLKFDKNLQAKKGKKKEGESESKDDPDSKEKPEKTAKKEPDSPKTALKSPKKEEDFPTSKTAILPVNYTTDLPKKEEIPKENPPSAFTPESREDLPVLEFDHIKLPLHSPCVPE